MSESNAYKRGLHGSLDKAAHDGRSVATATIHRIAATKKTLFIPVDANVIERKGSRRHSSALHAHCSLVVAHG
jgi:hypothetical protein